MENHSDLNAAVSTVLAKYVPRFVNPQLVHSQLPESSEWNLSHVVKALEDLVKNSKVKKVEILSPEHDPKHPARAIACTGYALKHTEHIIYDF